MSQFVQADPSIHEAKGQLADTTGTLELPASASTGSSHLVPSLDNEKRNGLDATSLAKWNKLAERGGIGKAVA